jgi:WD40 repeat protein
VYSPEEDHKVNSCTLAADGRTLFVAAFGCVIRLDLEGGKPPHHLPAPAHAVTLSPDGMLLATQLHNSPGRLYDLTTGEQQMNSSAFAHFDFSPDNRWVSLSSSQKLQLFHRESLDPAAVMPVEPGAYDGPRASAFSADSQMIALPFNQVDVRLYRVQDGQELATLSSPGAQRIGWGRALEFSRDGRWLLALREDGEVIAWDLRTIREKLAQLDLDW